jgi:hypothetical protein
MKKQSFTLLFFLFSCFIYAQNPVDYAIRVSAAVQKSPSVIVLSWPKNAYFNNNIYIYKKLKSDDNFGSVPIATLIKSDTSYTDSVVEAGINYDYKLTMPPLSPGGYYANGQISSGIEIPAAESRGKLILVYDKAFLPDLKSQIDRLVADITADGWLVITHGIDTTAKVTDIHSIIQSDYNADKANTKAVFLLGHVPVPYSGGGMNYGLNPIDGHYPDHKGAWPADIYYGDMTGAWTDNAVTDTIGIYKANHNLPGDGKFDQDITPNAAQLQVGRVDLFNLPAFAPLSEKDLMKRYLDKDHRWRIGQVSVNQQGLVIDHFGTGGRESMSACGYKNFTAMFGPNKVTDTGKWESNLSHSSYLWSYGSGDGNFTSASGISSASTFAADSLRTVFTMLIGSWFGDWNSMNNYLRAPLASKGLILTNCWSGRPQFLFHDMAMGETIGYSTLLSANDYTNYFRSIYMPNAGQRMIHVALMGDPTLRMYVVQPAGNFYSSLSGTVVKLHWASTAENSISGYYLYRTASLDKPFTRIGFTTDTLFADSNATCGQNIYMVRAIKLQRTASGSYYNLSQGVISPIYINNAPDPSVSAGGPLTFCQGSSVTLTASKADSYAWSNESGPILGAGTQSFNVTRSGIYHITESSRNGCGATSAEMHITVNPVPIAAASTSASTFYYGYTTSVTLSGTSDISGSVFSWTSSPAGFISTDQNPVVAPFTSTTYYLTATSPAGCPSVASSVIIQVQDVRCGPNLDKIQICDNCKSFCKPKNTIDNYLQHHPGSYVGFCSACSTVIKENEFEGNLDIYPNPFTAQTTIAVQSTRQQLISIQLWSLQGKKIEDIYSGIVSDRINVSYAPSAGTLKPGIYILKLISGTEVTYSRLEML